MNDLSWIDLALRSARPRAVGALLRYFRDLDGAEEAFQEACLSALKRWPESGPPHDPAAWLIMVGRNSGIDQARRRAKLRELPDEEQLGDTGDSESELASRLDEAAYRDDVLRLLFICCHPELPATQQIALALRIICGLTVKEIARAFLVGESAMEQRITRAKRKVGEAGVAFETPDAEERAARVEAVSAVLYLMFNEGYSATGGEAHIRVALCEEALRLGHLLLGLFEEPEVLGLVALMLLQHARTPARLDAEGEIVLLEDQDRTRWDRAKIEEGLQLLDRAMSKRQRGPYQLQAAIAALHARAARAADTDWREIAQLYAVLEQLTPSPVITLNRAVALSKAQSPAAALALLEPLAKDLDAYFHFHGVRGALLAQLGREAEARESLTRAISLARTTAEATHIRNNLDRLLGQKGS